MMQRRGSPEETLIGDGVQRACWWTEAALYSVRLWIPLHLLPDGSGVNRLCGLGEAVA